MRLPTPFNNPQTYPGHRGVDYPVRGGLPVPAGGPGVVINRGYTARAGNFVEIRYDIGVTVFACHFQTLDKTPAIGTRVVRGTTVGVVGTTGNSTGNHLHEEVTGYATTAGYWKFHDPNDVIGGGTPSGNVTERGLEAIQKALSDKGYYKGSVDGIWGDLTTQAVKGFQKAKGLVVDGIYGVRTDAALFPSTPTPPPSGGGYNGAEVSGVHGPNPFGIPYTGGLQKIARLNGYSGSLDQNWGDGVSSGSMAGLVNFLRSNWGYSGNTVLGPQMWQSIQRWLRSRWGYTGAIDGIPGPLTRQALLRADTANWSEL